LKIIVAHRHMFEKSSPVDFIAHLRCLAVAELLPPSVRAGGFAIAYAAGASLFGGTTQLVVTWLIGATGDPNSPAWYVTGANLVSILAILALPASTQPSEQTGRNLR
jgi:hypothetical protein